MRHGGYIHHNPLLQVSCKLYPDVMLRLFCPSYKPTLHQTRPSTQMSGQLHTIPAVTHETVNHSHFVDPTTGVHTQHIESYWKTVKGKLKHMRGCHATQLPSYLDEFMWRETQAQCCIAFHQILQELSIQCNQPNTITFKLHISSHFCHLRDTSQYLYELTFYQRQKNSSHSLWSRKPRPK